MRIGTRLGFLALLFVLNACRHGQDDVKSEVPENGVNPESINNPATASSKGSTVDMLPAFKFEEAVAGLFTLSGFTAFSGTSDLTFSLFSWQPFKMSSMARQPIIIRLYML